MANFIVNWILSLEYKRLMKDISSLYGTRLLKQERNG